MLKNNLLIALRRFKNDKLSTVISLMGLALGMACCMLILIYVREEMSYNQCNKNLDQIYNLNWVSRSNGQTLTYATSPIVLGPNISPSIPAIDCSARFYPRSGQMQTKDGNNPPSVETRFQEQNVYFADPAIFRQFSISFLKGNSQTALRSFNTVVITDEMARKYFGTADPIGKSLFYDNQVLLRVSDVVKKMPFNSDIQFDFLVDFETLFSVEKKPIADFLRSDWTYNPCYTFVLLKPGQQPDNVNRLLNQLLAKSGNVRNHQLNTIVLQPFRDTHLRSSSVIGALSSNNIVYMYVFEGIAFLILVIANINFINLATARAVTRAQEVGMRRLLGAQRSQLIGQFLIETLLISTVAFFLALLLTQFALPVINELTNQQFDWHSWLNTSTMTLFTLAFIIVSIAAGLYPAFYITRVKPALSIKGKSGEMGNRQFMQRLLMVCQFAISLLLISGAMIIYQQLQYLRNKPLGFQKEQIIVVPIFGSGASTIGYGVDGPMRRRMNQFSDELARYNKIKGVTAASLVPGQGYNSGLVIPQGFKGSDNIFVPWASVDYNFIQTFQIALTAGRDFSKNTGTDHLSAFIINESAVRRFGWTGPADAVGKNIIRGEEEGGKKGQVIGVIKDFNFNTLDQPLQPLILDVNAPRFTQFAISIQADHIPGTIEQIKRVWGETFPERLFEYSFLDKDIQAAYKEKENLGRIIEYFAAIAILLSCLGLFSLSSFLSVQRTREIGIRKVLGATIWRIVLMLSSGFMKWVLVAVVIASPISYFIMKKWLQDFAFRININWWVFGAAGMMALLIAGLTVSFHTIKTAHANPITALRNE
jgi:putative ABC transport system permease protein